MASFISTDLPPPAGPRMMRVSPRCTLNEIFCSTGFTSKLNRDIFERQPRARPAPGSWPFCCDVAAGHVLGMVRSPAEDADHRTRHNKVDDDDEDRRNHHSLRRRAPHALRSALGLHAEVAADRGDDESRKTAASSAPERHRHRPAPGTSYGNRTRHSAPAAQR